MVTAVWKRRQERSSERLSGAVARIFDKPICEEKGGEIENSKR